MAKTIQFKRGTTAQVNAFTGALGEVVVDTDKDVLVVHDGATAGGFPNATRANADGTVTVLAKSGTNLGTISASGLFNNTLTSTSTTQALTAAQGKVLQDSKLDVASSINSSSWQLVTGSRALNTVYTNSSGKPMFVAISITDSGATGVWFIVNGTTVMNILDLSGPQTISIIVPDGATYSVSTTSNIIASWAELV